MSSSTLTRDGIGTSEGVREELAPEKGEGKSYQIIVVHDAFHEETQTRTVALLMPFSKANLNG